MRNSNRILVAVALLVCAVACKTPYALMLESNDFDGKYKMAMELFESKRYGRAADMFESLSAISRGTPQDDTIQFYWGLSNYRYSDFVSAEGNFDQFINTFPLSPFVEEAKFLRLNCLYKSTYRYELDPRPTQLAIREMKAFKVENPDSKLIPEVDVMLDELNDRLELKAYKGAHLYYHMEDYLAAHYALKNVLKENAENRYREDILYYTAMSAYKYANMSVASKQRERYLTFVDDYFNIISEYPETHYRKELDGLYAKAQEYLNKHEEK